MFGVKQINYSSRVFTCEDGSYRFDILYYENLYISDNKTYSTIDECLDALCAYMKKLCAHSFREPFTVQL